MTPNRKAALQWFHDRGYKFTLLALASFLVSACNEDRPPKLVTVCDESKTQIITSTGVGMNGQVIITTTPLKTCVRSHLECQPAGAEYKGDLTCQDLHEASQ